MTEAAKEEEVTFDLNIHIHRLLMDEPFFAALSRRMDKRATTALPTGPANGVYIAGSGGGGASSAGQVAHGYGAVSSTTATTTASVGYGGGEVASAPAGSGFAGRQGMVVVWEYK